MSAAAPVPTFTRSVVCFLDVLGVSAMATAPDAATTLVSLKAAISSAAAAHLARANFPPGFGAIWFTDNVVLTWPWPGARADGELELGYMYTVASWFTLDMALAGFFVRGGVTAGDVYVDDLFAFGPALIDAVELEKEAVNPCVALSHQALRLSIQHVTRYYGDPDDAPQSTTIVVDDRMIPFLNYLDVLDEEESVAWRLGVLGRHRYRVMTALAQAADPHVRAKFQWLAAYHDHYCERAYPDHPALRTGLVSGTVFFSLGEGLRAMGGPPTAGPPAVRPSWWRRRLATLPGWRPWPRASRPSGSSGTATSPSSSWTTRR